MVTQANQRSKQSDRLPFDWDRVLIWGLVQTTWRRKDTSFFPPCCFFCSFFFSVQRAICRPQAEGAFHLSETGSCGKRNRKTLCPHCLLLSLLKMICWNWSLTELQDILLLTSQIRKCFWPPPPPHPILSSAVHLHHRHENALYTPYTNFLQGISG